MHDPNALTDGASADGRADERVDDQPMAADRPLSVVSDRNAPVPPMPPGVMDGREGAGDFLAAVARVSPSGLYVFDVAGMSTLWVNRPIVRDLGYTPGEIDAMGEHVLDRLLHPDDRARYGDHHERLMALAPDETERFEYRMRHADGSWRHFVSIETPYGFEDGRLRTVLGAARDVTEFEAARERDALLARELNHRVKNLFAIVPALVDLSMRGTKDPELMRERARQRMSALARAHTITIAASSLEEGVLLEAMVEAVLEPYGESADRFMLSGPPVRLASRGGSAVGLALHELATNAIKYGALSAEGGLVRIAWVVDEVEGGGKESGTGSGAGGGTGLTGALTILWEETGGPPLKGEPETTGFGTRLIDTLVVSQGGQVRREWRRHGMRVEIEMPLYRVGAEPKFPEVGG